MGLAKAQLHNLSFSNKFFYYHVPTVLYNDAIKSNTI